MCFGGSYGTGGLDCVLEDVSNTMMFSVCSGGSSGTGGLDCVLEVVYNTLLFSVA